MFKQSLTAAAAVFAVVVPVADAHVTLQPRQAPAGGYARMDVRVPNERDTASTAKVVVQFPEGFPGASTEPVPGWTAKVRMRELAEPVVADGEERTEELDSITFTAEKGAEIGPGQFRDFGVSLKLPDRPGETITFKALQTYTGGEVVRWIGEPDADEPAPTVTLTEAAGGHGGASGSDRAAEPSSTEAEGVAAAAPRGGGDDGDGAPTGLVVAALVAGLIGLGTGVAGLSAARRPRTAA